MCYLVWRRSLAIWKSYVSYTCIFIIFDQFVASMLAEYADIIILLLIWAALRSLEELTILCRHIFCWGDAIAWGMLRLLRSGTNIVVTAAWNWPLLLITHDQWCLLRGQYLTALVSTTLLLVLINWFKLTLKRMKTILRLLNHLPGTVQTETAHCMRLLQIQWRC